ncbi:hypothetical protein PybrP1_012744 [[Pythium] brassicae (nom. inval.)]|nr:hypothetical protein PybrP1_012744 [[Pythium] brassicae (nom. inval.)]
MPAVAGTGAQPNAAADGRLAAFDKESAALLAAPVATPLESLQRLVQRDRGRRGSNAYLERVQQGGMTAAWRRKMVRWMFEVNWLATLFSLRVAFALNVSERSHVSMLAQ